MATRMTVNGVSTTNTPGTEHVELIFNDFYH